MKDEIKKALEEVILHDLGELEPLESGSEKKKQAVESLATLYKLNIEEAKLEHESVEKAYERGCADEASDRDFAFKDKQLREAAFDRYFRLGMDVAGLVLPLVFYGIWMKRGLSFEETGTFTSTTFRGLFNNFKPTKR